MFIIFLCGMGKLSKKQLPSNKGMTEKFRPLARLGFTKPTPFCRGRLCLRPFDCIFRVPFFRPEFGVDVASLPVKELIAKMVLSDP